MGCNVTNAAVAAQGGTDEPGQKRIAFADFGGILSAVKADTSSTGCKEDYIEGLKVGLKSSNKGKERQKKRLNEREERKLKNKYIASYKTLENTRKREKTRIL